MWRLSLPDGSNTLKHLISVLKRVEGQFFLAAAAFVVELHHNARVEDEQLFILPQLLDVFDLYFFLQNMERLDLVIFCLLYSRFRVGWR